MMLTRTDNRQPERQPTKRERKELYLVAKAIRTCKVREVADHELVRVVAASITKAFTDCGQQPSEQDFEYLFSEIPKEIKEFFPSLRIDEIPIAIRNGVRGKYGKYFGLNLNTFCSFFKDYLESDERVREAKAMTSIFYHVPEPSRSEVEESVKKLIVETYGKYLKNEPFEDYGNFIYNKLDELGLVYISSERKKEIFERAKEEILNNVNGKKAGTLEEHKQMNNLIKNIVEGTDLSDVKIRAKKIALLEVFRGYEFDDLDLNRLVGERFVSSRKEKDNRSY